MPHALYWADYCRVKSTDNLCNQETKASIFENFNKVYGAFGNAFDSSFTI
jgi:hypothetical protein